MTTTMNLSIRRAAAVALLAGAAGLPALAQTASATTATAAARGPLVPVYAPDADLLAAFGGKPGIQKLADVFVDRMRADARIGRYFEKTKLPALKESLGAHLCVVLAGPCVYEGDSMKASHEGWGITRADSLAQVEILQATMNELGIPFRAQNQLLARLAPMYRDIIER